MRRLLPGFQSLLLLLSVLGQAFGGAALAAEVVRCKDAQGNWQYTDDRRRCRGEGAAAEPEPVTVTLHNSHSIYGKVKSEEYYNYPFRDLVPLPGYDIPITIENELLQTDPELAQKAALRLQQTVAQALNVFPAPWREQFEGVRYYIFYGQNSSYGGGTGGFWYMRPNNPVSERLSNAIVVRSAQTYVEMPEESALYVAVHELAHGFHYYNWSRLAHPVRKAYQVARRQGLYRQVEAVNGEILDKAYALTNDREYFAELTAIFFLGGRYHPFTREGLAEYDPAGYRAVRDAWLKVPVYLPPTNARTQ